MSSSKSLASELLDKALAEPIPPRGWLGALSDEHRQAVEAAKSSWNALTNKPPASRLARVIVDKMSTLGYAMPKPKQVAEWLLQTN